MISFKYRNIIVILLGMIVMIYLLFTYFQTETSEYAEKKTIVNIKFELNKLLSVSYPLSDSTYTILKASDTLAKDYLMYFRFTRYDCSTCVQEVIEMINNMTFKHNQLVCIVGDFSTEYEKVKFEQFFIKNENLRLINVPKETIDIEIENLNIPYFFRVDSTKHIINIFLVDKNNVLGVDEFLSKYEI